MEQDAIHLCYPLALWKTTGLERQRAYKNTWKHLKIQTNCKDNSNGGQEAKESQIC